MEILEGVSADASLGYTSCIDWTREYPKSCPEWFAPLPGRPGNIFLNPSGHYDGDPARE